MLTRVDLLNLVQEELKKGLKMTERMVLLRVEDPIDGSPFDSDLLDALVRIQDNMESELKKLREKYASDT